jgi:hypothetical protein
MRTKVTFSIVAMFAFVASISVFPHRAFGDTYEIFQLTSDQGYAFDGMDDLGNVVIVRPNGTPTCGVVNGCFYTFLDGVSTGSSSVAPTLVDDNGTACSPSVPAGGSVEYGVCNHGREAFTGELSAGQRYPGVYTAPDPSDLLASGGGGPVYMNSLGDIVWDDRLSEDFYEAVDLTTTPVPEPGSFFLLGSGILAAGGMLRRRVRPWLSSGRRIPVFSMDLAG